MSGPIVTLDLGNSPWCTATPAQIVENLRDGGSLVRAWVADQIEAQIPKPKPAEPTGLGAVVEDAEGVQYVRSGITHDGRLPDVWRTATGNNVGAWSRYRNIDVVRVLSEGVTA